MTDQWSCLHCGTAVGHLHAQGCPMSAVGQAVWLGPPVTPGMVARQITQGDPMAGLVKCLHCEQVPQPGEVVFESRTQAILIHVSCVLQLADQVPKTKRTAAEIEEEYEHALGEIGSGA